MIELGVNIDHVATLRQARQTYEPDPVVAAALAEQGGATGITFHLREDRRHIQERDVELLVKTVTVKTNFEIAVTDEVLAIACRVKPTLALLVPESRREITTEGGLNVRDDNGRIATAIKRLHDAGILVSLFLDPEPSQIDAAARLGVDAVELHTGPYAHAALPAAGRDAMQRELTRLRNCGRQIVDAGMRELRATGWMHNRTRMIAGSLLTKNLRVSWQQGEAWFWDTLVDADLASNSMGWQWIQGCGADAAPYFRIFNPIRQGERFDADGEYVRRWVPELAGLPAAHIHSPGTAPAAILDAAGIRLGRDYPRPVVDPAVSRREALAAYDQIRH